MSMNSDVTLARVRQFLLIITAGIFIMTVLELIFVGHWNENIQYLPFGLCALGLLVTGIAYLKPNRNSMNVMRWSMIVIAVCSFIGFYEHLYNNYSFWLEIQPNSTTTELITATFNGGIPILAPGILLLGAVIGLTAIYKHPLLEKK
jgi:hypothetical protein